MYSYSYLLSTSTVNIIYLYSSRKYDQICVWLLYKHNFVAKAEINTLTRLLPDYRLIAGMTITVNLVLISSCIRRVSILKRLKTYV